jgi:hypothetical protein
MVNKTSPTYQYEAPWARLLVALSLNFEGFLSNPSGPAYNKKSSKNGLNA